ncbi:60Kd inner membrane protein-domain-containing protein [Pisolithus orientalis]|uniref:60Kd inner membrane protein-domain-containing protein n=1 Tax=Pisolithus orientalis TaxID=936130 RepID=UPI0022256357|nr:60Kd inner membrane protein-domain-containing protein [Pisolithus orientalis]KAI6035158.1 60Kd inner membrane protein-domain-containing protein [Pisolithus orientalis]
MLARYASRTSRSLGRTQRQLLSASSPHRTITSLDTLADGFLDLATALPIPPSWPPYSTAIILCTVLSRLVLTVPFSIWAKRRQWRAEEAVMPIMRSMAPQVARSVSEEMTRERVHGTKEQIQAIHSKRVKEILTKQRKLLFAEHRCQPAVTMLIPPVTQLPIFVGLSILFSRLSQAPTPFDSESFFSLSTLTHADPTGALPIALGFITLANVESSRWFMTDTQLKREEQVQQWKEQRIARGETVLEPQKIVKSSLRLVSVGRIVVASMVPGSVVLYWVTSAAFGLVQTWMLDYWELRRKRNLETRPLQMSLGGALGHGHRYVD